MPPPNRVVRKPSVTKPVPQGSPLSSYKTTSTDTWNKPTSTLPTKSNYTDTWNKPTNTLPTKSTVIGSDLKEPQRKAVHPHPPVKLSTNKANVRAEPRSTVKRSPQVLPGSKLKPLHTNPDDRYSKSMNTWDPSNRPINANLSTDRKDNGNRVSPVRAVKVERPTPQSKSQLSQPSGSRPSGSRSSSVASTVSNKPVLPSITGKSSTPSRNTPPSTSKSSTPSGTAPSKDVVNEFKAEKHARFEEEAQVSETPAIKQIESKPSVVDGNTKPTESSVSTQRPQSSKARQSSAVNLLREAAQETKEIDKITDYFVPEWYKDPLVEPETIKSGIVIFCSEIPDYNLEEVTFYPLRWMIYLTDIKAFMEKCVNECMLALTYYPKTEEVSDATLRPPPVVPRASAEKINESVQYEVDEKQENGSIETKTHPYYVSSLHDPELYHLSPLGRERMLQDNFTGIFSANEDHKKIADLFDFDAYCLEIAGSLTVKSVNTVDEIEAAINKYLKRRTNIIKQEKAQHSHVYLETTESDDIYNHVKLCHKINRDCFKRTELLNTVKSTINGQFSGYSSPVLIAGPPESGKTWLAAQIPFLFENEAKVITRFCGLTRTTRSFNEVLQGIFKQLHALYGTSLFPKSAHASNDKKLSSFFKDVLKSVSDRTNEPVVIVLDAFDKLSGQAADHLSVVETLEDAIPNNICVVLTMRKNVQDDDMMGENFFQEFIDMLNNDSSSLLDILHDDILKRFQDLEEEVIGSFLLTSKVLEPCDVKGKKEAGFDEQELLELAVAVKKQKESPEYKKILEENEDSNIKLLTDFKSQDVAFNTYDSIFTFMKRFTDVNIDKLTKLAESVYGEKESDGDKPEKEESEEKTATKHPKAIRDKISQVIELKEYDEMDVPDYQEHLKSLEKFFEEYSNSERSRQESIETVKKIVAKERALFEENMDGSKDLHTLCTLDSKDRSTYIEVNELTEEEGKSYMKHVGKGKLEEKELSVLCDVVSVTCKPLYLRLLVNRCALGLPAKVIVDLIKSSQTLDIKEMFSRFACKPLDFGMRDADDTLRYTISLIMFHIRLRIMDGEQVDNIDKLEMHWAAPAMPRFLIPPFSMTDAERFFYMTYHQHCLPDFPDGLQTIDDGLIHSEKLPVDIYSITEIQYVERLLEDCRLDIYEQMSVVRDVEKTETHVRYFLFDSDFAERQMWNLGSLDFSRLALFMVKVIHKALDSNAKCGYFAEKSSIQECMEKAKEIFQAVLNYAIGSKNSSLQCQKVTVTLADSINQWIKMLFSGGELKPHEADLWEEDNIIYDAEKERQEKELKEAKEKDGDDKDGGNDEDGVDNDKTETSRQDRLKRKAPVTTSREKGYPQGRWRVAVLQLVETYILSYHISEDIHSSSSNLLNNAGDCIELVLQYDFFLPLLQDYGVDYVLHLYRSILTALHTVNQHNKSVWPNQLAIELLCNLLASHSPQLRENPSHFYTLFLSMFNDDASLTSRAARRLYSRVMHEVDVRNRLHLITMLVKIDKSIPLSNDTTRYLQRTQEKYAAAQCISNASYILSHNCENQVKLWELTGEFICAQTLEGRIVTVCAQREQQCFLAVVEEVTEVGQRFASVWYIDRLKNKKVADLKSKHIKAAWVDPKAEKIVLVEQHTVDEVRVVICIPQSIEIESDDKSLRIVPYKDSSFLSQSRLIPMKINDNVLEMLKTHLSGDKKEAEHTELQFYKTQEDNSHVLDTSVETKPLVYASLESLWDDILEKADAKEDFNYPMREIRSEVEECGENISKMKVTLHGMSSTGDIIVDLKSSTGKHKVHIYKLNGEEIVKSDTLYMDESAAMTLMPTDDFIFSDTGEYLGLVCWNLATNDRAVFGNEQKEHVTCLQFEVEEGQILSFTRGQVTAWNAIKKNTEGSFILDKNSDVVAACLQDNWLAISNQDGELTLRFEIRKKMDSYHFHEPIDWIDSHVIGNNLYVACHLNGDKPSVCFLKYHVSEQDLYKPAKYIRRSTVEQ